jgi:uncharacterized protein (TIGR00369 family)
MLDGRMLDPTEQKLTPLEHSAQNRCFGCGDANPIGLHLRFFLAEDGTVVCPATIPDRFEGHPGYLHGGIIATLLDEVMSKVMRSRGVLAMTRHMEVDYLRPVPSGAPLRLEGRMTHLEGRKRWAEAKILDGEGTVLAAGKGLFVEIPPRGSANPGQP